MSHGVFIETAHSAARFASGLLVPNGGKGSGTLPSQNCLKMLPNSPWGPIAVGMKLLFASLISPMTSSADSVFEVISFVPPVRLTNFFRSPSLRRKTDS